MDSEPDYKKYSIEELRDVARHIDRQRFPVRARDVADELAKRLSRPRDNAAIAALERFNRWQILTLASLVACLPLAFLVGAPLSRFANSALPLVTIAFVCVAAAAYFSIRASSFRCPRCNERFTSISVDRNPFVRSCQNCGFTHPDRQRGT